MTHMGKMPYARKESEASLVVLPHWERLGREREHVRAAVLRSLSARGLVDHAGADQSPRALPPLDDLLCVRAHPQALLMIHRTRAQTPGGGVDLLTRYVYVVGDLALIEDVNLLGLHRFATLPMAALPAEMEVFLTPPAPRRPNAHGPAGRCPSALEVERESDRASLGEAALVADILARPAGIGGPRITRTVVSLFALPGGTYAGTAPLSTRPRVLHRVEAPVGAWAAGLLAGAEPDGAEPDESRDRPPEKRCSGHGPESVP